MGVKDIENPSQEDFSNYAVALDKINKTFGQVKANDNICLKVKKGTIHGIIGENGAGKSTIMNILFGFYQADSGDIYINGEKTDIHTPNDAIKARIGMVFQHFMLIDRFTVLENVILGVEEGFVLNRSMRRAKRELQRLEKAYKLDVDVNAKIKDLPVGLQQRVEILKALFRGLDILILDEPTGVLTPQEADHLFCILDVLKKQGKTIIFISHKLQEVLSITDNISVMRQGQIVADVETKNTSRQELAELMVGRKVLLRVNKEIAQPKQKILEVKNLSVLNDQGAKKVKEINFDVKAGEIVGIAGVAGNGQTELLEALGGMRPLEGGEIFFEGKSITPEEISKKYRRQRISHIPEDRLKLGLIKEFSMYENSIMGYHRNREYNRDPWLLHDEIEKTCDEWMETYDVRPRNGQLQAQAFSGGNQQKLVVAREVEHDPTLVLVGQPTRGVDIGAIEFIHKRLIKLRDAGKAILLVSVELEEIMSLSDRILVMFDGTISGELRQDEADEKKLGCLMAGVTLDHEQDSQVA